MMLPGERALREERHALVATVRSLTDEEFASAPTLCAGWAPRDILAHVMGVDRHFGEYLRAGGWISTANEVIVGKSRALSREELMGQADTWLRAPAPWTRAMALQLLGDNAIHHQDILRPLGRTRVVPDAAANAILREGLMLGAPKLLRYRVEPTDGGRAVGRGRCVRGTREALGMWLSGRDGLESELQFDQEVAA